jgi:methyl-accepting chemotaxis protein
MSKTELIKSTWEKLCNNKTENGVAPLLAFAETFYTRLFEENPEYKKTIFKSTNMVEQGKKLVQILGVVIKSVDHLEEVKTAVENLGKRHVKYGVYMEDQYMKVAGALLYALEKHIGSEAWTEETKAAWTETYVTLMKIMLAAAANEKDKPKASKCEIL